jgi:hypothetical protein
MKYYALIRAIMFFVIAMRHGNKIAIAIAAVFLLLAIWRFVFVKLRKTRSTY